MGDSTMRDRLARTGALRVGIAVGGAVSAVWAMRDQDGGEPRGPTVDLARIFARRLDLPLALVEYGSSGEIIEAAASGAWDVAFAPVDAERKKRVDFGTDYVLSESTYLVPSGSTIATVGDVDRRGTRVVGVENTATIRSARRTLSSTAVTGVQTLDEALALFRRGEVDALALGTESLLSLLPRFPGARILDGHFHSAGTAVAVPLGHRDALEFYTALLEELKADGTIRQILDAHGMKSATVAPANSRT